MNWVFKTKIKSSICMIITMSLFIFVFLIADIIGGFEYQVFLFSTIFLLIIIGIDGYLFFSLNDKYYLENDQIIIKNRKQNTIIDIKEIKRIEVYSNIFKKYRGPSIKNHSYMIITYDKKKKPEKLKRYNDEYYKIIENDSFLDIIKKYDLKTMDGKRTFFE